jgi:hypothetical protein
VNGEEAVFDTEAGTACGRSYPMRARFDDDMRRLARTFGRDGGPPLYVTLFTEFQTYACVDNAYSPTARVRRYYVALKSSYWDAMRIFRAEAANARVSIGWGGWQMRWDDPAIEGGRSMIRRFAGLMRESDFISFQAMSGDDNVRDVRRMTWRLGRYGPVMLAHYKPEGGNATATFDADVRKLLWSAELGRLTADGLFAMSFMDHSQLSALPDTYRFVRERVRRHGTGP